MKRNIRSWDRIIRIVVALLAGILYISGVVTGTFGVVLMVAAVILLVTGIINFCPLYYLIGINKNIKS
jgi:hypothetical protein